MQKTKFNKFLERLEKVKLQNKLIAVTVIIGLVYVLFFGVHYAGKYIEICEINAGKYTEILTSEMKINVLCFFAFFFFSYIFVYMQNKLAKLCIKKAAKKENIPIGKLPNKSLCTLFSIIFGLLATKFISKDFVIFINEVTSIEKDPIFAKSISYYILQRPFIVKAFRLLETFLLAQIVYVIGYYIACFGYFFKKGLGENTRKKSAYKIHVFVNILVFCLVNILETMLYKDTILFTKLKLNNDSLFSSLMGSGYTDVTIKLVYFKILPLLLFAGLAIAIWCIVKKKYKKIIYLPITYVALNILLYIITGVVQTVYVKPNELIAERKYIQYHLDYTKKAYDIDLDKKEVNVASSFTKEDTEKYVNVLSNLDAVNYTNALAELNENVEDSYIFSSLNTIVKEKEGKKTLYFLAPKEIDAEKVKGDYLNKYIKYTHGNESVVMRANIDTGKLDEVKDIKISNPNIYYGTTTNTDCIVNPNVKIEEERKKQKSLIEENYEGEYGISMRRLYRGIMALKHFDYNFLMTDYIKDSSKFLINRNIIERVKLILPNMLIDPKPYMIVGEDNKQYYVIDAYTVSNSYPYSKQIDLSKTNLVETNNYSLEGKKVNYIRNSVKVIVDPYTGKLNIFNTDKEDIISTTYSNMYPNLFDKIEGNAVYAACYKHFKYPKTYLDIQLEVLKEYFVTHPENFYKNDNVINIPKYIDEKNAKVNLSSYYTFASLNGKEEYILMQPVVDAKEKLSGYYAAYSEDGVNKLDFYEITNASTVLSPMLLDKQLLVEDAKLARELENVKEDGNNISKKVILIPLDNKLLHVQIYFVSPEKWTQDSRIYKVVVSDGKKIAVGKDYAEAIQKIISAEDNSYITEEIIRNDLYSNIENTLKIFDYVKKSMKQGDFEVYGREMKNLEKELEKLKENYNSIRGEN